MSVEKNLRVVDDVNDAFNAHDWERLLARHAESVILFTPDSPDPIKGREGLRKYIEGFVTAIPDLRSRPELRFADGDWVCQTYTNMGTNTGPLTMPDGSTIPATNKSIRLRECLLFKIEDGTVTELHLFYDQIPFMQQLGLMK